MSLPNLALRRMRPGLVALLIVIASGAAGAQRRASAVPASADNKTIVHALNRLGFGPAPGDIERVRRMGLSAYIEEQLNPSRLDDSSLNARLAQFKTLTLSTQEIARTYYLPAQAQRREVKRAGAAAAGSAEMRPEMTAPAEPVRPAAGGGQGERQVLAELMQQKVLRAIYSER